MTMLPGSAASFTVLTWSTSFRWLLPEDKPSLGAPWVGTSIWSPRAAPTPCTAAFMASCAISASMRPTHSPTHKLPLTQGQYGASLGGPIIRDRTFFFSNFEQRLLNQSGLVTISQANVNTINARLAAVGYQGPLITTGLYPNPVHNINFLGKVDHQFSPKDQFSVRYSLYDVNARNSRGAGALSAPTASSDLDNKDQTVAVSNTVTLSPRTVNETRGQFTYSDLKAPPSDLIGPAVSISGVASFGTSSGSPTGRVNRLYEIVDNLSYQAGAHALRVGTDFLYNSSRITYPRSDSRQLCVFFTQQLPFGNLQQLGLYSDLR